MADSTQMLLGGVAVALLVGLPVLFILLFDLIAGRRESHFARWRRQMHMSREHRRAIKQMRKQHGIPLEQLARDLRRLRGVVGKDAHRSAAHQLGNRLAYDNVLVQVCTMLEIEHNLNDATGGMERDIERFRVEAELERAGVILSDKPGYDQAA